MGPYQVGGIAMDNNVNLNEEIDEVLAEARIYDPSGFVLGDRVDEFLRLQAEEYVKPIEACINCRYCAEQPTFVKFWRHEWDSYFHKCGKFNNLVHVDYVFSYKCKGFEMKE